MTELAPKKTSREGGFNDPKIGEGIPMLRNLTLGNVRHRGVTPDIGLELTVMKITSQGYKSHLRGKTWQQQKN